MKSLCWCLLLVGVGLAGGCGGDAKETKKPSPRAGQSGGAKTQSGKGASTKKDGDKKSGNKSGTKKSDNQKSTTDRTDGSAKKKSDDKKKDTKSADGGKVKKDSAFGLKIDPPITNKKKKATTKGKK